MIGAFLATILWSISAVSGARASRALGGARANFWRLLVATVVLAAYAHTLGGGLFGPATWAFFFSGLVGIGFGDVALYEAYPRLGPRLTVLLVQCFSAPFAALIEWVWLGTTLSVNQMLCGAAILVGVAVALSGTTRQHTQAKGFVTGVIFAIAGAAGNGIGAVLTRKAYAVAKAAGESIDGVTAAYQRMYGGIIVAIIVLAVVRLYEFYRGREPLPEQSRSATRPKRIWPWVVVNGLAGQALGVSCYQWALQSNPTGIVLPIVAITPIVAIPFTYYLDGERPTTRSLVGGFIAVAGAVALALLVTRS